MKPVKTLLMAAVAAASLSIPALAQEAEFQLPEQCTSSTPGGMDHSSMGHGGMHGSQNDDMHAAMMDMMGMGGMNLEAVPEHVQENMRKMMITMPAMHEGMMNDDADVAFACGMIAHHQGAIDMAQVLLEHGDDPQMRALAEEIIEAQVAEIEQMTNWLVENAN
ncbi:DUF305 domain-containing protein [Chelativorans sp. ZYF759]|jgi:uncharacterized protein (DUF305 family)|uniref:CopM family metallochaperone n=1 Tax=Chelativorans sp. ZYF759 TaxID=2692213 RepID=UPI00145CD0FA|nr:DUF305 domain-containing protein [Chelativorans sp. ZYF759]NMG41414.1 DUF305 domain-containing protein [Chelativorans sp. ZYF759]